MSYNGINNLNQLATGTPLAGASSAELAQAIREIKLVLKNVLLQAHKADGSLRGVAGSNLETGSVGTEQIVDGAVTAAKIADLIITAAKIANGTITGAQLADDAVTYGKIAANAIGSESFRPNSIPLTALSALLGAIHLSSSSSELTDALRAITSDHIRTGAVLDRCIAAMALEKLTGGVAGQILVRGASAWEAVTPAGGLTYDPGTNTFSVASTAKIATFGDLKSRGANGGDSIAASWTTRDLGEIDDVANIISFTGNVFSLAQGSYLFFARCPVANAVGLHQARLFRDNGDTTNQIVLWGSSGQCGASNSGESIIQGTLVVDNDDHTFEIQHYTQNAVSSTGLGVAASSDNATVYGNHNEVYTQGYVIKLI